MEKKLYNFSYSPISKSFVIEEHIAEMYELSPLLISFETESNEVIWFNLWSVEGNYIGYIELSDNNFKNCLEYIIDIIRNY